MMLLCSISYSQNDTIVLKEVVVSEKQRTEQIFSYTLADTIKFKSVTLNAGDLISDEPGITVRKYSNGGLTTVSFRGSAASHTKVLWNNVLLNSSMNGQSDFSLISPVTADNIYILYGANSLYCNSGSLGGTINLESKCPENKDKNAEFAFTSGSFGLSGGLGKVILRKNKITSVSLVMHNRLENNYPYLNNSVLPNMKMKMQSAGLKKTDFIEELYYSGRKHAFSFKFWQSLSDRNIPPIMTNVFLANHSESQNDNATRFLANWDFPGRKNKLSAHAGFFNTSITYILLQTNDIDVPVFEIRSKSTERQFFTEFKMKREYSGKFGISHGFDLTTSQADITEAYTSQGYSADNVIVEGMSDCIYSISDKMKISTVVRLRKSDQHEISFIPGFYYAYFINNYLTARASICYNSNLPTLNDLYFYPGGNRSLKPEKAILNEINLQYLLSSARNRISVDFCAFYSETRDWILWQPTQYGYWSPVNLSYVFSKGTQLKLRYIYNPAKWKIAFTGNYTFNPATSADGTYISGQIPYIPKHAGNVALGFMTKNFEFFFDQIVEGERTTSLYDIHSKPLESYFITNIAARYNMVISRYKLIAEISLNNVFNHRYQLIQWRPLPGRNFSVTIKFAL